MKEKLENILNNCTGIFVIAANLTVLSLYTNFPELFNLKRGDFTYDAFVAPALLAGAYYGWRIIKNNLKLNSR